jgi:hypothetical protein
VVERYSVESQLEPVAKLGSDLRAAIKSGELTMTNADIRYMVDLYYQMQEFRKAASNQKDAADKEPEPNRLVGYLTKQFKTLEGQIQYVMDKWTDTKEHSRWAKSVFGIGPVIAAGLAAHIDMDKSPRIGSLWLFAGQVPGDVIQKLWLESPDTNPKKKPPFNKRLKVLCWKIGESFVKQKGREDADGNKKCYYGEIYERKKKAFLEKNANGGYAELAEATLKVKKFNDKKTRMTYESGQIPLGRIELMARRKAVKLFLAHWWEVGYKIKYKKDPPQPYAIEYLGHPHKIDPPGMAS